MAFRRRLLYVINTQAAAIVPSEVGSAFVNRVIDAQSTAQIEVDNKGNVSAPVTVPLTYMMPGLFSANLSGSGQGAIQNAEGSYNVPRIQPPPARRLCCMRPGWGHCPSRDGWWCDSNSQHSEAGISGHGYN
jgi:uncharacterized protein (TIGR03437 family)